MNVTVGKRVWAVRFSRAEATCTDPDGVRLHLDLVTGVLTRKGPDGWTGTRNWTRTRDLIVSRSTDPDYED